MAERIEFGTALLMLAAGLAMLIHLDLPSLVDGGMPRVFGATELGTASAIAAVVLWLRNRHA